MNMLTKGLTKGTLRKDKPQAFDTSIFDETLLSNFLEPIDVQYVYRRYQIEKILLPVTGVMTPWVKSSTPIWQITLQVLTLLLLVVLAINFATYSGSSISGLDLDEQLFLKASQVRHQVLLSPNVSVCNLTLIL